jgi:CBS domain-containing protein
MSIPVGKICECEVIVVSPDTSIQEAARLMKDNNVGALVVVKDQKNKSFVCGMLTDRDIVTRLLTDNAEVAKIKVKDAMTKEVETIYEDQTVKSAINLMQEKSVRRVPIIDHEEKLCGIAVIDDLILLISDQLQGVAELIRRQLGS